MHALRRVRAAAVVVADQLPHNEQAAAGTGSSTGDQPSWRVSTSGPFSAAPLEVSHEGQSSFTAANVTATLESKGREVKKVLDTVRGINQVTLVQELGQPSLTIDIDRAKIARYGINVADINATRVRWRRAAAPSWSISPVN